MASEKYNPKEFEKKWQEKWLADKLYKTPEVDKNKEKYYCLDMFPYPSGSGLHVGHPHGYLGSDVVARYMRLKGKSVLHPIGFDSFGLPAENFAIKSGTPPKVTTEKSIKMFKSQIANIGLSYDWDLELSTHDPEYYKWTQWLFLLFYKKGYAYKKNAPVNWCPKDQTVLANEQVIDGKCERCDTPVIQKEMEQWFYKITAFADRLDKDLDKVDWPESTKTQQRNWIGKSTGTEVDFSIVATDSKNEIDKLRIFTTRIDTIFGATFMVIAPEHPLLKKYNNQITNFEEVQKYLKDAEARTELERQVNKDKSGIRIEGLVAINPFNKQETPIYVADYVLMSYGTGAIMAVPAHDERDGEFAAKYNIPVVEVVKPVEDAENLDNEVFTDYGKLINSDEFNGMTSQEAAAKMQEWLKEKGLGEKKVTFRVRDWLLSRQRYWGAPIPIVYDPERKPHAIDEKDLPLLLPEDVDFKPTGESPIASSESFKKSAEEKYGKGWHYEVDTMDTFVDSSWYFLRFTDVHNKEVFAAKEKINSWLPVDLYIGGAEHTVLHLLYARFFMKVLFDEGLVDSDEPFYKLRHQGTILASDSRKMSKRWGNVINPDDEIEKYSADTLRVYEMFMGPFSESKAWNTKGEVGIFRFLNKVWDMQYKVSQVETTEQLIELNKTIKKVTESIEALSFNTAVAKLMEFSNFLQKEESVSKQVWEKFLIILAPFAPFITEELWSRAGNQYSIHQQSWPQFDEALTKDAVVTIAVQVNGKVRGTIEVAAGSEEADVVAKAKEVQGVQKYLTTEPKKVIYIKDRILSFIV